jgi:hypothetical protein
VSWLEVESKAKEGTQGAQAQVATARTDPSTFFQIRQKRVNQIRIDIRELEIGG